MEIRKLNMNEINDALVLIWNIFLEYEAPDYTEEGILEFKKSLDDAKWVNTRDFIGAFDNDELMGVIALKDYTHIALFFVNGKYHRRGIGKKLFLKACELNKTGYYTVNSSPYAKGVYEHLGFELVNDLQVVNGLKFFPMVNNNIRGYLLKNDLTNGKSK